MDRERMESYSPVINMKNIEQSSSPEVSKNDVVTAEGMRTRDKIFRTIGNTVEIAADTTIFTGKATGYAIGKTLNGFWQSARAVIQGMQNKEFPHSV